MTNLPPGPWSYDSDANCVRSAIGAAFCMANKTLANLLIRAEREADPTPLTIEDVERMLGKEEGDDLDFIVEGGSIIEFEWHKGGVLAWLDDGGREPMLMKALATHGEFRTFCRLFGIEVKA